MSRAHGLDDDEEKGLLVDPSLAETEAGDGVLLALSPSRSDSTPAGDDDDDDCHPLQVSSPTTIDAPILPESACEQPEDPPRNTAAAAAASSDTQLVAAPDRPPPTAADPLHQQLSEQETIGIIMTTMEKEDATDGLANQQQQSRVISTSSTSLETEPVRTDADPGHSGGVPLSLSSLDGKNGGVDKISPPPAVGGRSSSLPLLALHPPQQSPGCVNYRRGDTTILPPDGGGNSSSNSIRSSVFVSKLSRRMRFSVVSNSNQTRRSFESASNITHRVGGQPDRELLSNRRYRVGDSVLVSILGGNHNNNNADFATKGVNQYGFPAGQGETSEECAGPYNFTLATVQQVHFEEIHPYYTVTRCDNGTDQRANADAMAPIPTEKGEIAAKRASGEMNSVRFASQHHEDNDEANHHVLNDRSVNVPRGMVAWCETACYFMAMPFLWLDDLIFYTWSKYMAPTVGSCMSFCRAQSRLLLNGLEPYSCRLRLTAVNVVVICSFAFMFIDHIRLAFLSPSSDDAIAILSLVLWGVLLFELFIEVFIRPSGYQELIMSDKAYAPTTVRYINFLHFFVESLSLAIFVPEFSCLFTGESCSMRIPFSFYNALLMSVIGPTRWHIVYGFFLIALYRLRIIGLVRHWRNMWITRTFINMTWYSTQKGILSNIIPPSIKSRRRSLPGKIVQDDDKKLLEKGRKLKDSALTNASTIGTALMATNSYRALAIVWVVIGLFPVVISLVGNKKNDVARIMTAQLQETNLIASDTSNETCKFLSASVASWLIGISYRHYLEKVPFLLSLDLLPQRCGFDGENAANFQICGKVSNISDLTPDAEGICTAWSLFPSSNQTIANLARASGQREGSIVEHATTAVAILTLPTRSGSFVGEETIFSVVSRFNHTLLIRTAAMASILLQICLISIVLGGLSILRRDAELLVLGPLRRMLKIVAHYARNPLVQPKVKTRQAHRGRLSRPVDDDSEWPSDGDSTDEDESLNHELGSFETEQLITAVAKITDLLRKCWGVAGADIISTNLATREGALSEMFNPTVPGKSVYALFGFAVIGGFENALRNLGGDVMPLINDVAAVLHGEVFRWGFGDSGQCNKNLGSAFLMVFRIGSVKEVIEKLEQATDVVFSTSSGKRSQVSSAVKRRQTRRTMSVRTVSGNGSLASSSGSVVERVSLAKSAASNIRRKIQRSNSSKQMSLSLQSLPGISTFTDRAVIGMLKSYAGIHRDKRILKWNNDFRLGAGVGAFKISMIFGMDAGWAVEGAVGSEYKIDATYLSPHVNMASRMTSACRLYDVSIMLSQSVQELMSDVAQTKLRHLDTVTVKGSSVKQKIYTYDARARGVDFFLYSRSDEQADFNADRYAPSIWSSDQDLIAMRQHVTNDFLEAFKEGLKFYISGDWPRSIEKLEKANNIMFQTAVDEGYMEDEFDAIHVRAGEDVRGATNELKRENGDGPSMYLLSFMQSHGGIAPKKWDGWHPLTTK